MTLDDELEHEVASLIYKGAGPGERELRAKRLVHVAARAFAKLIGSPDMAAAEAFCVGRKLAEPRVRRP